MSLNLSYIKGMNADVESVIQSYRFHLETVDKHRKVMNELLKTYKPKDKVIVNFDKEPIYYCKLCKTRYVNNFNQFIGISCCDLFRNLQIRFS